MLSLLTRPIGWSFCIMMLDTVSFGIIMPVMPDLLIELGCSSISDAAFYSGILTSVFSLMQFIFCPLVGNLSDRFGRRPIILVSLGILCVDYVIKGLAHSMWLLFMGRIFTGITLANYSTALAAISDVSKPGDKAANFGLLGSAVGFGFIIGAVFGGIFSSFGARTPFYAAAFLASINMIFGFFAIKETVTTENKRLFSWSRANPLGAFSSVNSTPWLANKLLVIFFYEITFVVYAATWAFFTKEKFGWNANTIGISLGFFGVSAALVQGVAIRLFLSRLGEFKTVICALCSNILIFLLYAYISQPWMIFILIPMSAVGTLFLPAMQSLTSRLVKNNAQGELQGVIASIRGISIIIGPTMMTGVFSLFTSDNTILYFPGAPFLLAMVISALSLIILLTKKPHKKLDQEFF